MNRRRFLLGGLLVAGDWYVGDLGAAAGSAGAQGDRSLLKDLRVTGTLDADSGSLGSLVINGVLTLGPLGKIVDNDGSTWDTNGITLKATGAFGDTIVWNRDPVATYTGQASIQAIETSTTSGLTLLSAFPSGSSNDLSELVLYGGTPFSGHARTSLNCYSGAGVASSVRVEPALVTVVAADLQVNGKIGPNSQITRYLTDDGSRLVLTGPSIVCSATSQTLGFYGATGSTKLTATGARNNPESALAVLLALGATLGLWTDSTTAS